MPFTALLLVCPPHCVVSSSALLVRYLYWCFAILGTDAPHRHRLSAPTVMYVLASTSSPIRVGVMCRLSQCSSQHRELLHHGCLSLCVLFVIALMEM
ncbi:hypothetical protein Syun_012066 [Stephania yunnanensis]|uniref:Secreted protein n=1 Tax=Stephania yunnanensis TaxID=152371 RepID=A0AAP0JYX7_9MAGN